MCGKRVTRLLRISLSEGGEDLFAGAERLSGGAAERRFRVKRRFRRSEGGEGLLGIV